MKRFPAYPAVDAALVQTWAKFGFSLANQKTESQREEMRERAAAFDVQAEIARIEKSLNSA